MLPLFNNRCYAKFNDDLRQDSLGVWRESVVFHNKIHACLAHFPQADQFSVKDRISTASLKVVDTIAKSAYAKSREIYEHLLQETSDAISEAEASIYIAHKWDLVPALMYEELFNLGKQLHDHLNNLSEDAVVERSRLN